LQIEPELRAGLEPVTQTKRGVAGDGGLALDDLRDAVRLNESCRDNSVGVISNSFSSSARISPGWIAGRGIGLSFFCR
jgi:hypothetical protein